MRSVALAISALVGALVSLAGATLTGAQNGCNQLGGNVQSGNICHARVETPTYVIDLRWDTDYPDNQPVTDYLIQHRDQVVNAAQGGGSKYLPYQMTVSSETFRS